MCRTIAVVMVVMGCSAQVLCMDETCDGVPEKPLQGSAMLQVHATPGKDVKSAKLDIAVKCSLSSAKDINLKESRDCLPDGLQEKHLELLRRNAALFASGGQTSSMRTKGGDDATLDAAGFKEVTSMSCPPETEIFFNRLLESMDLQVCSKEHIQGLMHWFTGVPDMDFQYVIDIINNGNPCKYWAPSSGTCPTLSAECDQEFCR